MSANSTIEWTDHTFNPWWGCVRVSPGCEHCYAEFLSSRYGHGVWGPAQTTSRRVFGESHWEEPMKWNASAERAGIRRRVFCASMADVFEDHPEIVSARERLWTVITATPMLDWLLLTKRPENIPSFFPPDWLREPPLNVWLGTSVEDQCRGRDRIPKLVQVPAVVHFLSCEPLLEALGGLDLSGVEWIIVGGESGISARRMDPIWVRSLMDECREEGIAFFLKQSGTVLAKEWGDIGKGHTMVSFPADLRVREYPATALTDVRNALVSMVT